MIRFMLFRYSTLARVRMPLAATVPNSTMPAPPRTGVGTAATTRPSTGSRPEHHQDDAAGRDHEAALDPGDGDQANVLGERALGEGTEDRRDEAGNHVCPQARGDPLRIDLGAHDFADGQDVGRWSRSG